MDPARRTTDLFFFLTPSSPQDLPNFCLCLFISHSKLRSSPPTPYPHPQHQKNLSSQAPVLTQNPCIYCQTHQRSVIDTFKYVSPKYTRTQRAQLMWLQVPRCWRQEPGSSSEGSRLDGETGANTWQGPYQSFDSMSTESGEGRREARLWHIKGIKGAFNGAGGSRVQITMPLLLRIRKLTG